MYLLLEASFETKKCRVLIWAVKNEIWVGKRGRFLWSYLLRHLVLLKGVEEIYLLNERSNTTFHTHCTVFKANVFVKFGCSASKQTTMALGQNMLSIFPQNKKGKYQLAILFRHLDWIDDRKLNVLKGIPNIASPTCKMIGKEIPGNSADQQRGELLQIMNCRVEVGYHSKLIKAAVQIL